MINEDKTEITFRNLSEKGNIENYINNSRNEYSFKFNRILDMNTEQDEVFTTVAQDVVDASIDGYNGTIFAYGQTGSGKTYSMTGGAQRYKDRGIIPRTISHLFESIRKETDKVYTVSVSYMEIYNNDGYDLLHADHENPNLTLRDLPKVVPFINEKGELILKGLSLHKAETEEDLLNILFTGDTNRVVCETPMNDASTRSHCIFTIYLESRKVDAELRTYSKINLVDLSGSERVGKTGANGALLKEACSINLALHYLAQVIVTLQKKANGENVFVPYRNSLMTMMLKDSLGGNCKTRMIATGHIEDRNLFETISTCLFAQRVGLIQNVLTRNEAVDPNVLIARLKKENESLKSEIALLRGEKEYVDRLDDASKKKVEAFVDEFLSDKESMGHQPFIFNNKLMISHCLLYFKQQFMKLDSTTGETKAIDVSPAEQSGDSETPELKKQIDELRTKVKERDSEISVLLKLVNEKRPDVDEQKVEELKFEEFHSNVDKKVTEAVMKEDREAAPTIKVNNFINQVDDSQTTLETMKKPETTTKQPGESKTKDKHAHLFSTPLRLPKDQLKDKKESFNAFKAHYKKTDKLDNDLEYMKGLYDKGKAKNKQVKEIKEEIEELKKDVEKERRKFIITHMAQPFEDHKGRSESETALLERIELLRADYKVAYDEMHRLKSEIEGLQVSIKNTRKAMQRDFEDWWQSSCLEAGLVAEDSKPAQINPVYEDEHKENTTRNNSSTATMMLSEKVRKNVEEAFRERNELLRNIYG